MKPNSAAPDVDIKSRGVPSHLVIAGGVVACIVFWYSRSSGSVAPEEAGEVGEEEAKWVSWFLWILLRIVQLLFFMAFLVLVVLVSQQRKILYIPAPPGTARCTKDNPDTYRDPGKWGLPYEDVMIRTSDGTKVNAWLVYQPLANCQEVPFTFVYFHGNAGNIGHRLENIRDMHTKLKVNILIVDYRAYGDSEDGDGPSQRGFLIDAHGTYRWLIERITNPPEKPLTKMSVDRILIFGRSIGGAVGINLFADLLRERLQTGETALPVPAGIILENTFTSLRDMAVQVFPFLSPVRWLLRAPLVRDPWQSNEFLDFITKHHQHWCCCLLSGLQDQLVPPAQMMALHQIMKQRPPKVLKFYRFMYGGHNDTPTRGGWEYWQKFSEFLDKVRESEADRIKNSLSVTNMDLPKDE